MEYIFNKITNGMNVFEKNKAAPSIYTLCSSTFYVAVGLAIKKIKGIPASEILFFRSVICYIANYFLIKLNKVPIYTPTDKLHFMVMFRCFFGTIAHFCYY